MPNKPAPAELVGVKIIGAIEIDELDRPLLARKDDLFSFGGAESPSPLGAQGHSEDE